MMRFKSAASDNTNTSAALEHVMAELTEAGAPNDLMLVFMTAHHRPDAEQIIQRLYRDLEPACMIGCLAEGVIGGSSEIERRPGLSVVTASMPGVRLRTFEIGLEQWHFLLEDPAELADWIGHGEQSRAVIGFGDPWTTPVNEFLAAIDDLAPATPLIGGMASGGQRAGENLLFRDGQVVNDGFVGITLAGPVDVQAVVSQGCKPIGTTFVVTRATQNVIEQLGGRNALEQLGFVIEALEEPDRALLQHGLFIGRAVSEYRDRFGRGDFLIRNVLGVSRKDGTVTVAEPVRVGQTVQFQLRDADTADEDLRLMLHASAERGPAAGVLLFGCNGRGTRMFQTPGHDIDATRAILGGPPVGGFFAAGELGPIGGRNFIHGHTASLAVIRPAP